jgi:hypothetical protein
MMVIKKAAKSKSKATSASKLPPKGSKSGQLSESELKKVAGGTPAFKKIQN